LIIISAAKGRSCDDLVVMVSGGGVSKGVSFVKLNVTVALGILTIEIFARGLKRFHFLSLREEGKSED